MHWFLSALGPRTQSHASDLRLFIPISVHNHDVAGQTHIRVQVPLSDTNRLRMLR